MDDLKLLAKNDIQRKMSVHTVVKESFSHFSSTCVCHFINGMQLVIHTDSYPDILNMQLEILYDDALLSRAMLAIQQKLRQVVEGHLPHTENVLGALIMKLSSLLALERCAPPSKPSSDDRKRTEEDDPRFHGRKKNSAGRK